jgi:DNA-binding NtrC family response regulator
MASPSPLRVLITDDDADSAAWLSAWLEARGFETRVAPDARSTDVLAQTWRPDVVLLDMVLPDIDGLTLLPRLRQSPGTPAVIIVSGCATVRMTVDALGRGATSVLEKPVDAELLAGLLARITRERREPAAEDDAYEELGSLMTRDPRMRALFATMRLAAPTGVNLLVHGENGTGKELVASALHALSRRASGPFIKVNCSAIPATLLESELFGHTRGAFTGAVLGRKGLFEEAHHGSILLDEIGEMPLPLQAKLLRVLQEREFRPVGSTTAIRADFRLICATNVDLDRAVADGHLRQDLYFRLNTISLHVPPLRERRGDIRLLAERFRIRFAHQYGRAGGGFTEAALRRLEEHPWPGNVRELEHAVERAIILAPDARIDVQDLPLAAPSAPVSAATDVSLPAGCSLEEVERLAILHTLELTDWNKRQTAKILGIHRPTLYNKLRKYRLWRPQDRFRREPSESLG